MIWTLDASFAIALVKSAADCPDGEVSSGAEPQSVGAAESLKESLPPFLHLVEREPGALVFRIVELHLADITDIVQQRLLVFSMRSFLPLPSQTVAPANCGVETAMPGAEGITG